MSSYLDQPIICDKNGQYDQLKSKLLSMGYTVDKKQPVPHVEYLSYVKDNLNMRTALITIPKDKRAEIYRRWNNPDDDLEGLPNEYDYLLNRDFNDWRNHKGIWR